MAAHSVGHILRRPRGDQRRQQWWRESVSPRPKEQQPSGARRRHHLAADRQLRRRQQQRRRFGGSAANDASCARAGACDDAPSLNPFAEMMRGGLRALPDIILPFYLLLPAVFSPLAIIDGDCIITLQRILRGGACGAGVLLWLRPICSASFLAVQPPPQGTSEVATSLLVRQFVHCMLHASGSSPPNDHHGRAWLLSEANKRRAVANMLLLVCRHHSVVRHPPQRLLLLLLDALAYAATANVCCRWRCYLLLATVCCFRRPPRRRLCAGKPKRTGPRTLCRSSCRTAACWTRRRGKGLTPPPRGTGDDGWGQPRLPSGRLRAAGAQQRAQQSARPADWGEGGLVQTCCVTCPVGGAETASPAAC